MKALGLIVALPVVLAGGPGYALEAWQEALQRMPLPALTTPLARSNCLPILLGAFRSNAVVRAMVVLPGVSDDFYLLNRDLPLNLPDGTLWEAVDALEHRSHVRATFRDGFVLLHTRRDKLNPATTSFSGATVKRLRARTNAPPVLLNDRHWDSVQPWLRGVLRMEILPEPGSTDAWHFARHDLAAHHLSDWDLLCAISLTGGTKFTVFKDRIQFHERLPMRQ